MPTMGYVGGCYDKAVVCCQGRGRRHAECLLSSKTRLCRDARVAYRPGENLSCARRGSRDHVSAPCPDHGPRRADEKRNVSGSRVRRLPAVAAAQYEPKRPVPAVTGTPFARLVQAGTSSTSRTHTRQATGKAT